MIYSPILRSYLDIDEVSNFRLVCTDNSPADSYSKFKAFKSLENTISNNCDLPIKNWVYFLCVFHDSDNRDGSYSIFVQYTFRIKSRKSAIEIPRVRHVFSLVLNLIVLFVEVTLVLQHVACIATVEVPDI